MKYHDLRDFLTLLEQQGELKRITLPVDPHLEITEIADRTLRAGGPALLFENPKGYTMPVLCNLFGTPRRVALGMGQEDVSSLREVGKLLAFLKEPEPPKGFRDLFDKLPQFKQVLNMPTKRLRGAPCQQKIIQGDDVDLNKIPIMTCWPEDAAPLITWGPTVTRGPHKERQNLGIYRQQLIGKAQIEEHILIGRMVDDVTDLLGEQPRVDSVCHPAAGGDGKIDLQVAAIVPCQRGAAGARRQPQRRQRRCQPLSTAGHLPPAAALLLTASTHRDNLGLAVILRRMAEQRGSGEILKNHR